MADSVRVTNSLAISISNNTITLLTFDTEDYDTNSMHSTATNPGRLTCKTAGKFHIGAQCLFGTNGTGVPRDTNSAQR